LEFEIWNLSIWNLEFEIWNLRFGIWNLSIWNLIILMRLLLTLICFISLLGYAQTVPITAYEKEVDEQAQLIKKYFNSKRVDSMYALMAPSFKNKVSEKALEQGIITQLAPYGIITEFDFEGSKNGINKYKTKMFAGLMLQTLVGLDSTGMVETFAMQPYKNDAAPKRTALYNDNPMLTTLDSLADRAARSYIQDSATAGLSIAIYWQGKDYFYNYGEAEKASDKKATAQTVYEVGSITKTFVGYLLAKAVSEKKLSLDDPITLYLPDSVAANDALKEIKIVNLTNHSSGLPRLPVDLYHTKGLNAADPYAHYSEDMLFNGLKQIKPSRKPGVQYEYSNYAVGILGTILARVNKMSFPQMVETFITQPMQMNHTSAANVILPGQAIGYNEKMEVMHYWNFQSIAAAGSIKSSATDMLLYGKGTMKTMQGKSVISRLLTTPTWQNDPVFITLGWHQSKPGEAPLKYEHSGGTDGFRTHLTICPEKNWVVLALANQASDPGSSKVALVIVQQLEAMAEKIMSTPMPRMQPIAPKTY
jgi:CubicO group peptidase (beta-lactamase class C family)